MEHLPLRSYVSELPDLVGHRVTLRGFVEAIRDHKHMRFIILRDPTGLIQVTQSKDDSSLSTKLDPLTPETSITVTGTVLSMPSVKLGGIELALESADIYGLADPNLPISKSSGLDKWMDHRQVSLRYPEQQLIFKVQTTLEEALRAFWRKHGFREIHSPKLMGTASESGAEVFKVKYFETEAYLAQSPQFYKQMAIAGGMEKVFEIGPVFRAEPSFTSRHETEFTSIDMELGWIDSHHELMEFEEKLLSHAIHAVAEQHGAEIKRLLGVEVIVPRIPFPKIAFASALETLKTLGYTSPRQDDLDADGERLLTEHMASTTGHEFLFVTDYPSTGRAFYHMRHDENPELTKGFDLLWRGLEITTGAQREHRHDRLVEQAAASGNNLDRLSNYLDFFKYGCPPHGGMGLGLGRIMMRLLHASSIREVILLSRTPTRLSP